MAPFEAEGSSLAIPSLTLAQASSGAIGFSGEAVASGPLPGGSMRNLRLPLRGRWVPGGELALWRQCTDIRFDGLTLASLSLDQRSVTVCPSSSGAIVRYGPSGLRIVAGMPSLDLAGTLAETPIRLTSGPVGIAYPGVVSARELDVGRPAGQRQPFTVSDLTATFGAEIAGDFADAEVTLDAIPLDIRNASGVWRYAEDRLTLSEGAFRLLDREEPDRFEPLEAREATLSLFDNVITAQADLRHPRTDRLVSWWTCATTCRPPSASPTLPCPA